MGRFADGGHGQLRTVNEINVTPLMDLTFLLLIVFMITAPVLEYETDVSPPEMTTDSRIEDEPEPVMVSLTRQGDIIYQKQVVSLDALAQKLAFLRETRPDVGVVVRADGERAYKDVVDIMRTVRKAGLGVKLATQPES